MSAEVAIWRIDEELKPESLGRKSLGGMDYERRLEDLIEADLSIVDPTLMVIGRQVPTPFGGSIDILAIDAEGTLVVIELKRDKTPRDVVAQTLDYGSWVRRMTSEDISSTFLAYQRRLSGKAAEKGINEALRERFNRDPEELNTSHRLVIVAKEPAPSTERIVLYLQEQYGVDINVVEFHAFRDGDRYYLTRTWLNDPSVLSPDASPQTDRKWNGEFYVSFGEGEHRRWNDAKKYGFVSAGGGEWYVRTLRLLQPGNRVWVSVPGKGYVGVGEVTKPAVPCDEFKVNANGTAVPITEVEVEAPSAFDEEHGEHFVGVKWIKTVDLQRAVRERGFFGNQNTVAQPRVPKWQFTVDRLKSLWNVG